MTDPLFPIPIPVVVISGEYGSGKTLAVLTVGAPPERILLYDNEQSSASYAVHAPFHRVDLVRELTEKYPAGWSAIHFYEHWLAHVRTIEPGRYDVIGIDTIERLEAGLADWVLAHPEKFRSARDEKTAGFFWGDVKNLWGQHILELTGRCQTVILTAHMRDVFVGGRPVPGKRERRGKETLSELATLELELVRPPGTTIPAAKVIKSRLFVGDITNPSSIKPVLPPYLNPFTWDQVRELMVRGLTPEEMTLPPEEPEEEKEMRKLEMMATIAAAKLAGVGTEEGELVTVPPASTARCPVCKATASPSSDVGHAPWCRPAANGSRYDNRKERR